jgi:choline-sulfatase
MRLLHIDIDTLRPDHLGCYGYRRPTSPVIDGIAAGAVRFDQVYASDTPCLPSRTALSTGRFGIRTGVVTHGGAAADPYLDGARRGRQSLIGLTSWAQQMRNAGLSTTTISTFAERHSAYHWYAGFNEVRNLGEAGHETAEQVGALAADWLTQRAGADGWYLHVHFWDPHTPYRTPRGFEPGFSGAPPVTWMTEAIRREHWGRPGPHSAQEVAGFDDRPGDWPFWRQPRQIASIADFEQLVDGYDTGIRYADDQVGRLLEVLDAAGVADETAVMISSDHGESLGELGIYADHQTADMTTCRVPMILRWPGLAPRGEQALLYQFDLAATVVELLGGSIPQDWDATSVAGHLRAGEVPAVHDELVVSQGAWTLQRAVRFERWLCIRTYDDGLHGFPDVMLFDVDADPHEQRDVAVRHPEVVGEALRRLEAWRESCLARTQGGVDPFTTVLAEGGAWYPRGRRAAYLQRLNETGRRQWADRLTDPPTAAG